MSATHLHIHQALTQAIYTVLNKKVVISGVTYPVYKELPTVPITTYVRIGNIIDSDNGTKDDFVYAGSVNIHVVDESHPGQTDKTIAYSVMNKVRSLLKTSRSNVITMTGFTMIHFTPDVSNEIIEEVKKGFAKIQLIDTYRFNIE